MRALVAVVALVLLAATSAPRMSAAASGQFPNPFKSRPKFKALKAGIAPYTVEYPDDWQVKPGPDGSVTLSQKKAEAVLVIERQVLNGTLTEGQIRTRLSAKETEALTGKEPKATAIQSRVEELSGHLVVILDYDRPGGQGVERVRRYSIPIESQMFRITCAAREALFPNYDASFRRIAESLTPAAAGAGGRQP